MKAKWLTEEFANKVYDILVKEAGASAYDRYMFIFNHTGIFIAPKGMTGMMIVSQFPTLCEEWRFQGKFGFGGKYWSKTNKITYYPENHTKKLDKLQVKVNKLLGEIK